MIEEDLVTFNGSLSLIKTKIHLKNGIIHREDGPAITHDQGIKQWYLDGEQYGFEEYWDIQLETQVGKDTFTKFFSNEQQK